MAIAVDAVDDNARDIQARVEVLEAHHRGGNGGRDRFAVHQQDDRAAQLFSHRRAAAIVGVGTVTIVEAHHAFNDGNIGLLHLFAEQRVERRRGEHKAVEIAGRDATQRGVPAGVEIVRADLVGLNAQATLLKQR